MTSPTTRCSAPAALLTVGLLAGCGGGEVTYSSGYAPSHVEDAAEGEVPHVRLTDLGADRLRLRTQRVRQLGTRTVVPYAALIYDAEGSAWVYTADGLTFVREQVSVSRVAGNRVLVSRGPSPGTRVVTTGAAELYGSELGIEGGH